MNIEKELEDIKEQVGYLKEEYPDFNIHITVSKEFNDVLSKHLGTDDYSIRLEELY